MASIGEPKKQDVFTFKWTIHNFSCFLGNQYPGLTSPYFDFEGRQYYLRISLNQAVSPGFIFLSLDMKADYSYGNFMISLSIQKCNGLLKELGEMEFSGKGETGTLKLSFREISEPGAYLDHGALTVGCRLWKENNRNLGKSVNCYAETKFKIKKLTYMWTLDNINCSEGLLNMIRNQTTLIPNVGKAIPRLKIHLSTGNSFGDDAIYFAIEKLDKEVFFMTYNVYLLDSTENVAHTVHGEVLFCYDLTIWKFPFLSQRKLLSNEEHYFPNRQITLKCEFSFYGDCEFKRYELGILDKFQPKPIPSSPVGSGHDLWKENMRQFYSEGKYSDLIIRTPNREFPVHGTILCAQSDVFDAMLKHDMKEKNSGVFEITDFEDDTVSKMLMFLYTNTVDDIDYASVKDLYLAADKYRITPLQKICTSHLLDSMDSSNACDILLLADQFRDQELKSCARDFIVFRAYEIMSSDGWKSLKKANVDLVAETTEWMILNNFLNDKK